MRRIHGWAVGIVVGALLALTEAAAGQVTEAGGRGVAIEQGAPVHATSFWAALGDQQLELLIQAAVAGNHDLEAAAARVEGAKASRLQASLELAPIVTANAGYARRRFSSYAFPGGGASVLPDQDVWDAGLTGAWEIDAFGRVRGNVRARGAQLDAAEEDARGTEIAVSAEVASAYFQLRGLQEQLAVARRNADNQRSTLELTQARLSAGRGMELDVERARGQLAFTLGAIPALEAEVQAAEHRIAVLVGRTREELDTLLPSAEGAPALPEIVPAVTVEDVLGRRPDVRSARQRLSASRAATGSARAEYLPRLSVVGTAGYTAQAVDAFGRTGTFNYAVGPVLSWAAFDLGRVKARADEAQAHEVEARARYEDAELRAQEELGTATARYEAGRARLGYLEESARASERSAALARARFEGGVADFLEVLDAERTLLVAQDQLAQARTAAAEAYVGLYRARGGVWQD
jgi:NodT family efflux transporter outer membrane factor (OMF) lipoprotein